MSSQASIHVIITTYKREARLKRLLEQIEEQKGSYNLSVFVYNDGSPYNIQYKSYVKNHQFRKNNGKKMYWKIVNKAIEDLTKSDYYIMIPDDVELVNGFFDKSIQQWESIKDPLKICLNLLTDSRETNWTNFKRKDLGNVYKTQWNDMCFISELKFFKHIGKIYPIKLSRWAKNKRLSSGVGEQISMKLHTTSNMYQVKKSLVLHGDHPSVMNANVRKSTPIISI